MKKLDNKKQMLAGWSLLSAIILVVGILSALAYFNLQPASNNIGLTPGIGGGPPNMEDTLINEIIRNPNNYYGRTVTLRGEVDSVRNTRAFVMDQEGSVLGDEILVITRTQIPLEVARSVNNPTIDNEIIVEGIVRRFDPTDIERELEINLDAEMEREFSERPVVIADRLSYLGD